MWAVARRPRWIALLLLALVLAGVFAGLGKWQLERSIANGKPLPETTETRRDLDAVTQPGAGAPETIAGQKVTVTGTFVAGDTTILTGPLRWRDLPDHRSPGRRAERREPARRDRLVRPT